MWLMVWLEDNGKNLKCNKVVRDSLSSNNMAYWEMSLKASDSLPTSLYKKIKKNNLPFWIYSENLRK